MKLQSSHNNLQSLKSLESLLEEITAEIQNPAVFDYLFAQGIYVEQAPLGLTIHLPDGSGWDRASLDGSDKLQSVSFRGSNPSLITEIVRIATVHSQKYTEEHPEKRYIPAENKHALILETITEIIKQFHDQTYKTQFNFHQKLLAVIGNT